MGLAKKKARLCLDKLFKHLYWFLHHRIRYSKTSIHSVLYCICYGQICKLHHMPIDYAQLENRPWAAGISRTVKPFHQLCVGGHSNFHHVRVRFHLKGPIMSAKKQKQHSRRL